MALEIMIVTVLAGIVLGLRYKVLILVPAIAMAVLFAIIMGIARADHFWSIVFAVVVLGSAVQCGYLVGIVIRAVFASNAIPASGGRNSEFFDK